MRPCRIEPFEGFPARDVATDNLRKLASNFKPLPVEDSFGRWSEPPTVPSKLGSAVEARVFDDGALYLSVQILDSVSRRDRRLIRDHLALAMDLERHVIMDVAIDQDWYRGGPKTRSGKDTSERVYKGGELSIARAEDLTGKTFGYAHVLHALPSTPDEHGKRRRLWQCRCLLCESTFSARAGNLRSGSTTSCGCRRRALGGSTAARHQYLGASMSIKEISSASGVAESTIRLRMREYGMTAEEAAKGTAPKKPE
jgi:hypothetical protein